jgi:DNA polymerase (family X)
MSVHNEEVARTFDEMVRRSADAGEDPRAMLDTLPGIGADLAAKSLEIVNTGRCKAQEQLRKQVPHGLVELLHLPGLGPKRVNIVHSMLGVSSREDLERAVQAQALARIRGLGPKLNERLARELKIRPPEEKRWLRPVAQQFAAPLGAFLGAVPGVTQVSIAGSYRRGRETVGDLDILVSTVDAPAVVRALHQYDEVASWVATGSPRVTVVLRSGLQVDLRISKPMCFGAALHYFTGSKAHNIHVRRLAQERGLKINEYGVFSGRRRVLCAMEHRAFSILGHPTARLIGERRPVVLDMGRVVAAAKQRACFLELNGQPDRLDLDDGYCRMAREHGVLVSIASDAHQSARFINLDYAVVQARRGWLTPQDVLDTKPLSEVRRLLRATIT